MRVYLDNAATTPLDPEVFDAMKPFLLEDFGNPSSTHTHGRKVRSAIESARKKIAELLNCTPGEILFTSGGTEADNTILHCAVETYNLKHVISSPIEHHAVTHTLDNLVKQNEIQLHAVRLDEKGHVDLIDLENLLKAYPGSLVSLMQANNDLGNLLTTKIYEGSGQQIYFSADNLELALFPVPGIAATGVTVEPGPQGQRFAPLKMVEVEIERVRIHVAQHHLPPRSHNG